MSTETENQVVALVGNPNSGKTTLFNQLTGLRQRVGNYPGVTIEKKWGTSTINGKKVVVVDLPGTYSLVSRSKEESIAFDVLAGREKTLVPALSVVVLDASNLDRNLYLALMIIELGRPVVLAINMIDLAEGLGLRVDPEALQAQLGVPCVPIVATTGEGVAALQKAIGAALDAPSPPNAPQWTSLDGHAKEILDGIAHRLPQNGTPSTAKTAEAAWILASMLSAREAQTLGGEDDPFQQRPELAPLVGELSESKDLDANTIKALIEARYRVAISLAEAAIERVEAPKQTWTDRIDRLLLHRVLGPVVLLVIMTVVFQSIFAWAEPLMDAIEGGFGFVGEQVAAVLPEGVLASLIVDGVIAGVGAVLVFVPQIAILFFLLALLEDSGYLARAAYIMDRVMARVGLHGRAFVPLVSGFACAIPAILSARTIESSRDRLVTILVTPLISCSARLPVYALIIGALFSKSERILGVLSVGALLLLTMYILSVAAAVTMAAIFKRTLLKSPTPPLVLELPPYRRPSIGSALRRMVDRSRVFVRDAGTIILACSIVLWALLSYPKNPSLQFDPVARKQQITQSVSSEEERTAQLAAIDTEVAAEQLRQSYAGRIGHVIEPLIEPLGYDWKIGIGLVASFAAREVLVSTLGMVYGIGEDADEESTGLRETLAKAYSPLVGLSLMIFFLLACQCMSTVAIVRRETGGWRWPAFMVAYMTALAWVGAFIVFQTGKLLGFA